MTQTLEAPVKNPLPINYPKIFAVSANPGDRVVNLFNHANPVTGNMTLKDYNEIRAKFERLRAESSAVFLAVVTHMAGGAQIEKSKLGEYSKRAEKHGIDLGGPAQRSVAFEWQDGAFTQSHRPDFKIEVSRQAVVPAHYEAAARLVEAFRRDNPKLVPDFERLINKGSNTDMIWPEQWAKDAKISTDAGVFAAAVKRAGLRDALSLGALRTYIAQNPTPHPEIVSP